MEVGPPSNNDDLGVAWVAQVRRQLPLPRSVPAHVEENLDDDEYDNHSEKKGGSSNSSIRYSSRVTLNDKTPTIYSHVPVQFHDGQVSISYQRLSLLVRGGEEKTTQ